jgi:hypothetical protein
MRNVAARIAIAAVCVLVATGIAAGPAHADAPRQDDAPTGDAQRLAERFAPIIMLKAQVDDCDPDGEPYGPTSVEIVLGNPEVALRQVGGGDPVVMRAPLGSDLIGLGEGFFLDFPGDSLEPGCVYERDFDKYAADVPATVYAHVVQQPDEPDLLFVQYWFYWYYNDWNNKHESDWEGITLQFEAASVAEALESEPVAVGYSQHEGGERAEWDDTKLAREGDRPVVYSSAGSHASYYGSALYLGRSASEGFGCDNTDGPSDRIDPEVVVLPDAADGSDDPFAWLDYRGRWGERQNGAFNGPTGPAAKDRWLEPAPWFEELRPSSVVIPGGDSPAAGVISAFCGIVEFGSRTLVTLTTSPVTVLIGILILSWVAGFIARRTDWGVVSLEPIVDRRRTGQIIRAATRTYGRAPAVYILFGLVYIPAAFATGLLGAAVRAIPIVGSLLDLAGSSSGTNLFLAALVGSAPAIAAYVFVNTVVSFYMNGDDRGPDAAIASMRAAWDRRGQLFSAFLRAYVIVMVLLISFVGIPWAIRQLVRYQFAGQAVGVEGLGGRAALDRSSELVRGRWWHTALITAVLNGGAGAFAFVLALLLLVVASGIPLWIFSALVTLVYALAIPLAAISLTLLYGDAVAMHREDVDAREPALA